MARIKTTIIFLVSLLAGCVSLSEVRKMESFEKTSKAYDMAIRWSDFESASLYLDTDENVNISELLKELKQFKVTSYTIKNFLPSKDKTHVVLIARIEYFQVNRLIVKSMSYRQQWKYDSEQERWLLTSGLPKFK